MAISGQIDIIWSKQGAWDSPSYPEANATALSFSFVLFCNAIQIQIHPLGEVMVARDSGGQIFVPLSALDTKFVANICRAVKQ